MTKVRFYIESSRIPRTQVYPIFKGAFEFKRDNGKIYFRETMKDKLRFSAQADYALIRRHAENTCEEIFISCERLCGTTFTEYWPGKFTFSDCSDHEDRCYIDAKVDTNDDYLCWIEIEEDEISIYGGDPIAVTTTLNGAGAGSYVVQVCTRTGTVQEDQPHSPYSGCLDNPSQWCLKEDDYNTFNCGDDPNTPQITTCDFEQNTTWHREEYVTQCENGLPVEPPIGSGWQVLVDNCVGDGTTTWWRCPPTGTGNNGQAVILGPYNYGRRLGDVLASMVAATSCITKVKSDFFNINPIGDAPDNIAYQYAAANLHNVTVHQIGDIKNPGASNPAQDIVWKAKPQNAVSDLTLIYNVYYEIKGDTFILEHYSFFTSGPGEDFRGKPMEMLLDHSGGNNKKYETNAYATEQSAAFLAEAIKYDCGSGTDDRKATLFSADISYIEGNNSDEAKEATGFVLIANHVISGAYLAIDNNAPMQWPNLLANLHMHGKAFKSGKLNGEPVNFLSWEPSIKQKKFNTTRCCGENFDPNLKPLTRRGRAYVGSAETNIVTGRLTLELMY